MVGLVPKLGKKPSKQTKQANKSKKKLLFAKAKYFGH